MNLYRHKIIKFKEKRHVKSIMKTFPEWRYKLWTSETVTTIDSLSTEIKIILPEEHTSFSEDLQTTTNRSCIYGHIHMPTNAGILFLELYTIYAKCFLIRTVSHLSKPKKSWKYYPPPTHARTHTQSGGISWNVGGRSSFCKKIKN